MTALRMDVELWETVLGPRPCVEDGWFYRETEDNHTHDTMRPARWPAPDVGPHNGRFFFRAIAERVLARGGTVKAAAEERQALLLELQTGTLRAVAVHPRTGEAYDIQREEWQATDEAARERWWSGVHWKGAQGGVPCDVYLIGPEPTPAWWPGDKQKITHWCARGGAADSGARARLKGAGDASPSEKAVCRELYSMWREAGRAGGSPASIEATRARQG